MFIPPSKRNIMTTLALRRSRLTDSFAINKTNKRTRRSQWKSKEPLFKAVTRRGLTGQLDYSSSMIEYLFLFMHSFKHRDKGR